MDCLVWPSDVKWILVLDTLLHEYLSNYKLICRSLLSSLNVQENWFVFQWKFLRHGGKCMVISCFNRTDWSACFTRVKLKATYSCHFFPWSTIFLIAMFWSIRNHEFDFIWTGKLSNDLKFLLSCVYKSHQLSKSRQVRILMS